MTQLAERITVLSDAYSKAQSEEAMARISAFSKYVTHALSISILGLLTYKMQDPCVQSEIFEGFDGKKGVEEGASI
jgi:hypothetical protein